MSECEVEERELVLYGTGACHLCELAQALVQEMQREQPGIAWRSEDISATESLFQRYGLRIPVLRRPDGEELDWPFDSDDLRAFVRF